MAAAGLGYGLPQGDHFAVKARELIDKAGQLKALTAILEDDENKVMLMASLKTRAGTSMEKFDASALQKWALEGFYAADSMEDLYSLIFDEIEFAVAASGLGRTSMRRRKSAS